MILLLCSCHNAPSKPNVSGIVSKVKVERFDQAFFSMDTNHLNASLDQLYQQYPTFLPLYFEFLSPINFMVHQQSKSYHDAILSYFRDIRSLYDSVQKKFNDFNPYKKEGK